MRSIFLAFLAVSWSRSLFRFVRRLGGLGLFLLGILDSSFLFLPFGNDLLLIALVSSKRGSSVWILYVFLSALGSLGGVLLVDLLMRKMGEQGLEKFVKPNKISMLKNKLEKKAGWAIFLTTILPPPFPFTAFILTASALQTPRKHLFTAVFLGRLLRFTIDALLALAFGRQVLKFLNSEAVQYVAYAFLAIAIIGSALSVYKWLTSGRTSRVLQTNPTRTNT